MNLLKNGKCSLVEVVNVSEHGFWLLVDGKEYFLPFDKFPWFKDATVKAILNVELIRGKYLHWPMLGVDLSIDIISAPDKYPLVQKG